MLTVYPACFFKEDSGYSVIFPDLNYLSTCGKDLNEAFSMAVDCLAGYVFSCKIDGETLSGPSALDSIDAKALANELELAYSEAFVNIVTVDVDEYAKKHFEKAVKKTLTIPAWLNNIAIKHNINFSQVLQEALKAKLHIN